MTKEEALRYLEDLKEIYKKCNSFEDFLNEINRTNRVVTYAQAVLKAGYKNFQAYYTLLENGND